MEHLIELRDVYKIYPMGDEEVHALDGVSLTIDRGEFVAVVGSSGSGKSTAMNIIGCLDVPTSGTYHLGGVDVSTMNDDQQAEIRVHQSQVIIVVSLLLLSFGQLKSFSERMF